MFYDIDVIHLYGANLYSTYTKMDIRLRPIVKVRASNICSIHVL